MLEDQLYKELEGVVTNVNPEAFITDLRLHRSKKSILSIKADTDAGISLAEIAHISRKIGAWLEEGDVLKFSYNLEVSSPGIGAPLKLHRQYRKNVGRKLRVMTHEGVRHDGELLGLDETHITLKPKAKKRRKKGQKKSKHEVPEEDIRISFEEIKEAKEII